MVPRTESPIQFSWLTYFVAFICVIHKILETKYHKTHARPEFEAYPKTMVDMDTLGKYVLQTMSNIFAYYLYHII